MSIRWLLVTITFLAVACAAAKQGTQPWMVGVVTAMFALLMFCMVQAITSRGRGRVFAQGFSIVGLLVASGFEYSLATTCGSQSAYRLLHPNDENVTQYGALLLSVQNANGLALGGYAPPGGYVTGTSGPPGSYGPSGYGGGWGGSPYTYVAGLTLGPRGNGLRNTVV